MLLRNQKVKTLVDDVEINRGGRALLWSPVNGLKSFLRKDDGSLTVFTLFVFVMILMISGMAIDIIRHENTRTKLQNTLDRAILAAADLDQTLDPDAVVRDYFTKANMQQFLVNVNVEEAVNSRVVGATALANVQTWFMVTNPDNRKPTKEESESMGFWLGQMGSRSLPARASGVAQQKYTDIEVSLILDVSGSMNSYSRLTNLKVAAKEFVQTIVEREDDDDGITTVSIIPYNATVSLGPRIAQEYTISNDHGFSHCPRFPDAAFNSTSVSLSEPLELISHFQFGSRSSTPIYWPWCPADTVDGVSDRHTDVLVHSNDIPALQDKIDDLVATGNTAIDMGMKWGVAMLDPTFQPVVESLVNDSTLPELTRGRPVAYTNADGLKVVVLMTDGSNTTEYDLVDRPGYFPNRMFKSGNSELWLRRDDQYMSVADSVRLYANSAHRDRWSFRWSDGGTPEDNRDDRFIQLGWQGTYASQNRTTPHGYDAYDDAANTPHDSPDQLVVRVSWQDLFAVWQKNRVNNELFYEPYYYGKIGYGDYYAPDDYSSTALVNGSQADARLSNICSVARNSRIIVYAIAFEAPSGGQAALHDCASSPSHYFDVDGTDISEAFDAIAADITQLKLTQ